MRRVIAGLGTFEPGSRDEQAERWLRSSGADPVALLHVLDSIVTTPVEPVGRIQVPTLVVVGTDDERAASAAQLAGALPHGLLVKVPGDHSTALATPELTGAILEFLGPNRPVP